MIYYLANIIVTFIKYGLAGFSKGSLEPTTMSAATLKEIENSVLNMLDKYEDSELDYEYGGRVLTPFESHLSHHFSQGPQTRSDVVEGMLLSLTSVGEEIQSMIPGASVESRVDGSDLASNVLKGHLGLDIDTVTSVVYPIFMDLLKDGFVYRADSNTFVITTKVKL